MDVCVCVIFATLKLDDCVCIGTKYMSHMCVYICERDTCVCKHKCAHGLRVAGLPDHRHFLALFSFLQFPFRMRVEGPHEQKSGTVFPFHRQAAFKIELRRQSHGLPRAMAVLRPWPFRPQLSSAMGLAGSAPLWPHMHIGGLIKRSDMG